MYKVVNGSNPLITQFYVIKVDTISGIKTLSKYL